MLKAIRETGASLVRRAEGGFTAVFGADANPLYHSGALTIYFFWIVLVSGIYVFVFFETSIFGAYESVEYLSREQWYLGGVMRSLHRYASDAAVITLLVHMLQEFLKGRYRGARWFSWFTGVPLLWMVFPLGITGYWLVWDELAQYIAIASSELLDWLPMFTDPMARNFLTPESLSDRFFTLMAFLHLIGIPIFLVFGIWFHLLRISRPTVNPPRRLALGSLAALLVMSLLAPAQSQAPADLARVPTELAFDWFYLPVYPIYELTSAGTTWMLLVGSSLLLSLLPWLPRPRARPVAEVDLGNCNGCGRCFVDCPFSAVTMQPRSDAKKYEREAVVDPSLCTACGICAGACPSSTPFRSAEGLVSGIDMPTLTIQQLRSAMVEQLDGVRAPVKLLVYGCDCAADVGRLGLPGVVAQSLPCIGNLPPAFIDYALRRAGADGVLLTGCRPGDCFYRFGNRWVEERMDGTREPHLRRSVDRSRLRIHWAAGHETPALRAAAAAFMDELSAASPTEPDDSVQAPPRAVGHE